jgi:hypothetical protein
MIVKLNSRLRDDEKVDDHIVKKGLTRLLWIYPFSFSLFVSFIVHDIKLKPFFDSKSFLSRAWEK